MMLIGSQLRLTAVCFDMFTDRIRAEADDSVF